jgi:transposase
VPKPSHLRSVNSTSAPAAQGAAPHPSGVAVAGDPPALRTSAPAAQGAAPRPSGIAVASDPPALRTSAPAAQGAAPRSSGASVAGDPPALRASAPAAPGVSRHSSGVCFETLPKSGKRRTYSAAEKLRIVREAAACTKRGGVEALLRREGIYSSHLAAWRKELALHGSEALAGHKPGRKPTLDAKDHRIAELEKRAARLEAKLALAEKLIDLQKKVSAILGINLMTDEES